MSKGERKRRVGEGGKVTEERRGKRDIERRKDGMEECEREEGGCVVARNNMY